jgi:dolichyl-phosphate-mannose-protein mannosyltransferase
MLASFKRLCCSPVVLVIAAVVLRLAGLYLVFRWRPWVVVGPLSGGEVVQVARSIVSGKGFGNPLGVIETGPTAWICPVYPYIVAGMFKLGGIYTVKSRLMLLALNCVIAGLTILPIYAVARRTFGTNAAVLTSWIWVVLPSAWQIPIRMAWDSTLNAASFALIFWATVAVRRQRRFWLWASYGALWAIGILINASILSLSPFLFGWLLWELRKEAAPWLKPLGTAILVLVLGVAPWTLRNYLIFGKLIPVRSNFGLVLWMGNHPGGSGFDSTLSPYGNAQQASLYQEMGEIKYMAGKKREAVALMKSHPTKTLSLALRNAWTFWFGVTDRQANPWYGGAMYLSIDFITNAVVILFGLGGILLAWRAGISSAFLYTAVLVVFPPLYYLTRPALRFRFTIEPVLTILAAYGVVCVFSWVTGSGTTPAPTALRSPDYGLPIGLGNDNTLQRAADWDRLTQERSKLRL